MTHLAAFILASAAGQGLAAEATYKKPPLPYEDHGACPFECCVYRAWSVAADTDILTARRAKAKRAFRVSAGEQVVGVTGVVVTLRFGRAVVDEDTTVAGHQLVAGSTIPVLNYAGEGVWRLWIDGAVVDHPLPDKAECDHLRWRGRPHCAVQLHEAPDTVWWVKIRDEKGREGWSRETDRFQGKDACG